MALPLPPKSALRCDAKTAQLVQDLLTSVIAGHAQATTTYRFYEELDLWLGPWGQQGYPIAYGKFYNVAFTGNEKLMANAKARDWVWRTTILLQEALRDYVVGRVRNCTLAAIREAELRAAAFNSHPAAYDMAGLTMLAMVAPELMHIIATIPGREFSPMSENFTATITQVLETVARMSPQIVGNSLAALAGPAHTGLFARAAQQDQRRFLDEMALSRELGALRIKIDGGDVDYIPALDRIIAGLNAREFPDQGFARAARELIEAAEGRRRMLMESTNRLLQQSPPVRARVEAAFPNLLRPR
jgi:hypothetical protein